MNQPSVPLRAEGVSFRYPQPGVGLTPVSLTVAAGSAHLVGGPSGCGKSTLARCLTGLIPHLYRGEFGGAVWAAGLDTRATPLWRLSELVGLVLQNPASQMLASTVEDEILFGLENLGLPRPVMAARLEEALTQFGLLPLRGRAPQTLSGGEQQKLALAAVTARRPAALVLDEPLSMLDPTAAADFVAHTRDLLAAGTAVVFCEHRQAYLHELPNLQTRLLVGPRPPSAPAPAAHLPAWPHAAAPARLAVQGLTVSRGGRPVLRDLDFALDGGQLVALVGRNGVGKTTLLRSLAGLQPYGGTISALSAAGPQPPEFALVFQNPDLQLFNASVHAEIVYRLADPDAGLLAYLLAALDLERYAATPPLLLSEGEKRRVALAMLLLRQPRHGLLLDEPSLGQDEVHKATLLRLLRAYAAAGFLVIYATHDLELAAQADTLLLLGPDGLAAQGPPGEVFAQGRVWDDLGFLRPAWMGLPCSA